IFLAALSDNLFRLMLPEQWLPASVYLQFMCFAALLYPLHSINLNILKVKGRSDLVFYLGLYKKTVAIGIFFVSYHYGIIGILLGQTVSSVLAYLPNSFFSKRLIGYSVREQLVDFIPGLILSGLIGFGLWQMEKTLPWHDLPKIAVLAGVGMTLYLLGASIFKLSAYRLANEMIMNRFKGKSKQ
ncbi:MAG: polysaccharide biosynthesis C-terminal domain-containing protein, partial [Methylomicrobium sp.]|nr:polysaccharide biosynthesis C-terminal domain-containing protein [Methylomicrobium sp.]